MSKKMEQLYVMAVLWKRDSNINFVKQIDEHFFSAYL
jgi:hypothetical protein